MATCQRTKLVSILPPAGSNLCASSHIFLCTDGAVSSSVSSAEVVIVGSGIMGLLTARSLVKEGMTVAMIEKDDQPARQSSWAAAGILGAVSPWKTDPAHGALAANTVEAWRDICAELEQDCGFSQAGMLLLAPEGEAFNDWLAHSGEPHKWLHSKELQGLLGQLAPASDTALMLPRWGTLRPPRLCRALLAWLQRQPRFSLHCGVRALALPVREQRVTVLQTDRGDYTGDHYLVAAGAWSAFLIDVPATAGIVPVRGQMLAWRTGIVGLPPISMIRNNGFYALVRADGVLLVGSTVEQGGFHVAPTQSVRRLLCRQAGEILPFLADREPDYHWVGIRPGAVRPLIGQSPQADNLWLNTGHFRDGYTGAPASATLLASLLSGSPPPFDPKVYSP